MYEFAADVTRVIDGDTLEVLIDHGFKLFSRQRIRLNRINAPEKTGATKEAGLRAKTALEMMLPVGTRVLVKTHKFPRQPNTLERYLADIWVQKANEQPIEVSSWMLSEGYATPYEG